MRNENFANALALRSLRPFVPSSDRATLDSQSGLAYLVNMSQACDGCGRRKRNARKAQIHGLRVCPECFFRLVDVERASFAQTLRERWELAKVTEVAK